MDIYANYATDPATEVSGVPITLDPTTTIVVARFGNTAFNRLFQTERAKVAAVLDSEAADQDTKDATANQLMITVASQTLLMGWTGIQWQGVDLPYSVANAATLLAVKDFRVLVIQKSQDIKNYLLSQEAAIAKN